MDADVIVVGAGLAGLVAATEATNAGRRVIVVDQEPPQSLGGQAFWSLGGLFMVDTPEQRRLRIRDAHDLALRDWMTAAGFDRAEDEWPRRWAEAYVSFAAGEMRPWLRALGLRWFPIVGWAERRWNSVPRFHITWGTGPGVLEPFVRRARDAERAGVIDGSLSDFVALRDALGLAVQLVPNVQRPAARSASSDGARPRRRPAGLRHSRSAFDRARARPRGSVDEERHRHAVDPRKRL